MSTFNKIKKKKKKEEVEKPFIYGAGLQKKDKVLSKEEENKLEDSRKVNFLTAIQDKMPNTLCIFLTRDDILMVGYNNYNINISLKDEKGVPPEMLKNIMATKIDETAKVDEEFTKTISPLLKVVDGAVWSFIKTINKK